MKYQLWSGRPGYTSTMRQAMARDSQFLSLPDPAKHLQALKKYIRTTTSTYNNENEESKTSVDFSPVYNYADDPILNDIPRHRLFLFVEDGSREMSSTEIRQRLLVGAGVTGDGHEWLIEQQWMHRDVLDVLATWGTKVYLSSSLNGGKGPTKANYSRGAAQYAKSKNAAAAATENKHKSNSKKK
jgi:hypothetical protein